MQSADAGTLFQSNASLEVGLARAARAARTSYGAEFGSPIWLARSATPAQAPATSDAAAAPAAQEAEQAYDPKLVDAQRGAGTDAGAQKVLAMTLLQGRAWAATSGGAIHCVDLESGRVLEQMRGHQAPTSCLSTLRLSASRTLLISGSWDRTVRFWPIREPSTGKVASRTRPLCVLSDAASDFIKTLHVLPQERVLLSGGSDRIVRAWDLSQLYDWAASLSDAEWSGAQEAGSKAPVPLLLGALREHTRPLTVITSLAASPDSRSSSTPTIFSSDSMGRTLEFELNIKRGANEQPESVAFDIKRELRGSETGVYDVRAAWRAEEDEQGDARYVAEVWTASHDKTARLYLLNATAVTGAPAERSSKAGPALGRLAPLAPARTVTHPSYVKCVLPFASLAAQPPQSEELAQLLLTGSTDGDLRIWDLSRDANNVEEAGVEATRRTLTGEAVVQGAGAALRRTLEGHWHEVTTLQAWWRPRTGPLPESEEAAKEEKEAKTTQGGEWWIVTASLDGSVRRWRLLEILKPAPKPVAAEAAAPVVEKKKPANGMTEEEERELAELMSDEE